MSLHIYEITWRHVLENLQHLFSCIEHKILEHSQDTASEQQYVIDGILIVFYWL